MNVQPNILTLACLLGPTASGKTATALAVATHLQTRWRPVEIVSMDSALVYRGMDIGTAKPTREACAMVMHHLIDIVDPSDVYSAADFRAAALCVIIQIIDRGHIPLLVGGAMFYYRALTQGLKGLPAADPAIRAALNADAMREGWPALHARLADVDPITATRLAPNDSQRIQRALEIFMLTGQPMSVLLAASSHFNESAPAYHFVPITLEPSNRSILHERIAQRFDAMLANGFVDEVRTLYGRGDLHTGLPSMRCVGYRQVWAYLDGTINYTTLRTKSIIATCQLCKRQLTWIRSIPERIVIDCCTNDVIERTVKTIEQIVRRCEARHTRG